VKSEILAGAVAQQALPALVDRDPEPAMRGVCSPHAALVDAGRRVLTGRLKGAAGASVAPNPISGKFRRPTDQQ
jgi:hypothetical protein